MDEWILVDTCIWASFFSKPSSPEKHEVDQLIDSDRVAMIGPILAEVLLGFRRKDQADWVGSRLALAHYVDVTSSDWRSAADEGRSLAANGHKLPLTNLVAVVWPNDWTCLSIRPILTSICLPNSDATDPSDDPLEANLSHPEVHTIGPNEPIENANPSPTSPKQSSISNNGLA